MLQKPSKTSKSQEYCKKLEDRLAAWKDGRTDKLIQECRTIQRRFSSNERRSKEGKAKTFAKLVFQRKINAAMKLLTDIDAGVHKVDDTILTNCNKSTHSQHHWHQIHCSMVLLIVFCPHTSMKLMKLWFSSLPAWRKEQVGPHDLMQNCIAVFLRVINTKRKTTNFEFSLPPWLGY